MQLSTLLTASASLFILLLSLPSPVQGTCFQSGYNWGDHPTAKAQLKIACKSLKGNYDSRAHRTVCRNNPNGGNCYAFQISNNNNHAVTIDESYCYTYIAEQIDNCGHGGKISHSSIEYRGDPNKGHC